MLPTLLTLGNLYFGFAAISACGREMYDLGAKVKPEEVRTLNRAFFEKRAPSYLSIAAWMLVVSMLCDALDGRVARKTGASSRFGQQLDTIADVVSFGAAPALMMVTLIFREVTKWGQEPFGFDQFSHAAALIGGVYVCCAALRLARFTVEASPEEAAHSGFKGMPSPGAAAAVASLVYLHDHFAMPNGYPAAAHVITHLLPFCTLLLALLMVSRIPYRHIVSSLFRKRPLGHVITALFVGVLLWLFTAQVLALAAWAFVISGPISMLRGRTAAIAAQPQTASPETCGQDQPDAALPLTHKKAQ
jgi:CDP-diacylglycerol--serine O-phosphatidyltransferase